MKAKHILNLFYMFFLAMIFCAVNKTQQNQQDILLAIKDSGQRTDTVRLTDTVYLTVDHKIIDSGAISIRHILDSLGVRFTHIVTAQVMEETGWLTCTGCSLDHNNPFGFRYKKKYLMFESLTAACVYYRDWQDKWYKGGDYYEFLECVRKHTNGNCTPYAQEPRYINYVKQIVKQLK